MPKELEETMRIFEEVEQLMLEGFSTPYSVWKRLKGGKVKDYRTCAKHISAVKKKWAENPILDLEGERKRLYLQSLESQSRLEEKAEKMGETPDSTFYLGCKRGSREERIEQKRLLGLDEKIIKLESESSPFSNLSPEEVQKKLLKSLTDEEIQKEYERRFNRKAIPSESTK